MDTEAKLLLLQRQQFKNILTLSHIIQYTHKFPVFKKNIKII